MDTQSEYSKIVDVHAVALYKRDLFDLDELLKQYIKGAKSFIYYVVTIDDKSVKSSEIEKFLNQKSLHATNRMSIEAFDMQDEVSNHIRITFYDNYVQYHVSSLDEGWFLAIMKNLDQFLSSRKPWFWFLKTTLGVGILTVFAFVLWGVGIALISSAHEKSIIWYYILAGSLMLLGLGSFLGNLNLFFPFTQIIFLDKSKPNYQRMTFIVSLVTLTVSIIGSIIIPLLTNK